MVERGRRTSAIYELDVLRFGGPTVYKEVTKIIQVTDTELIESNPDRLEFWITNNGPNTIYWSKYANPTSLRGHLLGAQSTLIVRAFDDGAFAGESLHAIANLAASTVTVSWIERAHREG